MLLCPIELVLLSGFYIFWVEWVEWRAWGWGGGGYLRVLIKVEG